MHDDPPLDDMRRAPFRGRTARWVVHAGIAVGIGACAVAYLADDPRVLAPGLLIGAGLIGTGLFALVMGSIVDLIRRARAGQLELRMLWRDGRPPPASPARQLLRVVGRLSLHLGAIGLLVMMTLSLFMLSNILVSPQHAVFLGGGFALAIVLCCVGVGASFLDDAIGYFRPDDDELD